MSLNPAFPALPLEQAIIFFKQNSKRPKNEFVVAVGKFFMPQQYQQQHQDCSPWRYPYNSVLASAKTRYWISYSKCLIKYYHDAWHILF